MQPLIGPPTYIPTLLLTSANGWVRISALAIIAASLVFHVVFLVRCFRLLRQWGRELDEQKRQREARARELAEQEWESQRRHAAWMEQNEREHAQRMKALHPLVDRAAGNQ